MYGNELLPLPTPLPLVAVTLVATLPLVPLSSACVATTPTLADVGDVGAAASPSDAGVPVEYDLVSGADGRSRLCDGANECFLPTRGVPRNRWLCASYSTIV